MLDLISQIAPQAVLHHRLVAAQKKFVSSWNRWAKWMVSRATSHKVWGRDSAMPADTKQDYEQKIRRLRDLAAEVRLLAADMRHHQSRASLLQIAAAYDDLASILSRLASSPNWLTFSPSSPSTQPSATSKD